MRACSSGSSAAVRPTPAAVVEGFVRAQAAATPAEAAVLVREYGLPREALPSEHLTSAEVWEALLDGMPMTAMIRNLASMTRVGVLTPGSHGTAKVVSQLGDGERIRSARVHPSRCWQRCARTRRAVALGAGRVEPGARGRGRPRRRVLRRVRERRAGRQAAAARTRRLRLDDVGLGRRGPGPTPRDASAALALVTAATEPHYETVGFFAGKGGWKSHTDSRWAFGEQGLTPLAISPRQRLDDVVKTVSDLPFGGTDCALPMLYARAQEREVDAFVIYTDSETWAGHPSGPGAAGLPSCVGDRRPAGGRRHGLERILDRRSRGSRDARRRRFRHGDAEADLRVRARRPPTDDAPPPSSPGGGAASCLRSSAEEHRASNPGAEVRILSGACLLQQ